MPIPFADSIYYNYDFGDDWTVRITCVDAYASDQDFDWTSPGIVNQETGEREMPTTQIKYTDSDGNEVSEEEAAESKDWARWMGWTGRKNKAENIL